MVIPLTGNFVRFVDEKLRIAIPKTFRESLTLAPTNGLYLAPGTDGSLTIYTEEGFARFADRLAASPPNRRDVRTYMRLMYGQAKRVEIDRQGRIRLPAELAASAGIESSSNEKVAVVILGVNDHMELWEKTKWDAYLADNQPEYDTIAEEAFKPQRNERPAQD
ncbi:MAG: division/cell wall cluster transcriptional repressor MraZ [Pirellulales bacterium]|nr:division/cell wall cluster transcriptional repressor MraZ [Pirellulales bacterium]